MSKNLEDGNGLTKLDVALGACMNLLGEAVRLIEALERELRDEALKEISRSMGSILFIKSFIPEDARVDYTEETPIPDEPLTDEQHERVSKLTTDQIQAIDEELLRNVGHQWRKMAMVIGLAMTKEPNEFKEFRTSTMHSDCDGWLRTAFLSRREIWISCDSARSDCRRLRSSLTTL
jgi:hypothetical protein